MANKRTMVRDLQTIIDEIHASNGLPNNLSTEAQLWDEIMKKEVFLLPEQLFPLIREVHGKEYPRDTPIRLMATEYSVERLDTKEISSIRADITVQVAGSDIYHFECEIKKDETMVIRMFEYDVHAAITYAEDEKAGYRIRFPHSAVLYLENSRTMPDELVCPVIFQDGTTHEYKVPVIQVQCYTLEDIREKHLCVLLPFLPLRFRPRIKSKTRKIQTDELTDFYQQIILILNQEVADGHLSVRNQKAVLSLLRKSMIRVFYRDESLLKEVITLTEPVLELEFETVERLKRELVAEREAKEKELAALRETKKKELAAERQQKEAYREELERLRAELAGYQAGK